MRTVCLQCMIAKVIFQDVDRLLVSYPEGKTLVNFFVGVGHPGLITHGSIDSRSDVG